MSGRARTSAAAWVTDSCASTPAQAASAHLLAGLEGLTPDHIFDEGLHEFLTGFITESSALGAVIHDSYLSGDM